MLRISYYRNSAGQLAAKWPGKTVYIDGKPRKEGQINLGLVVDRDKEIFWNRKHGYCTFDPETGEFFEASMESIPSRWREIDGAKREPPVCVDFGDSYFLNEFIRGIGYNKVIDTLQYGNRDRLYSMLCYYVLEDMANSHAETWYRQNFVRLLYPKANLASQRISEMLSFIGNDNQKRAFLKAHIRYVLGNTDGDVCVLIDSTGFPNSCALPITRISNHEGDVNLEFRMIALVQKSTGLPLYYEIIPGNIVDVSTTDYIRQVAGEHGCSVNYMIGDAGYCCPKNIEKLILSGIDFMTRINPTYDTYAEMIAGHMDELHRPEHTVRFHNRLVQVVKESCVIGKHVETGQDVSGYLYLCLDRQSRSLKESKLFTSDRMATLTKREVEELCARFGIFAIVTTMDLPAEKVLPEYYVRQKIEQFFDFGKNYAKFLPVRQHNMQTLGGHMLLGFIASFLVSLLNNRLNLLDTHYIAVPDSIVTMEGTETDKEGKPDSSASDENCYIEREDGRVSCYIRQDPIAGIFQESPSSLFYELRGQKAQVFDKSVIPCVPVRQAKDFYEAFRLVSPTCIRIQDGMTQYEFDKNQKNNLTKKIAFSVKPAISDEDIESRKQKKTQTRLEKLARSAGYKLHSQSKDIDGKADGDENVQATQKQAGSDNVQDNYVTVPKKRGRPVGSKNKKTLEREAKQREEQEKLAHKRGRKPGSKNRKTLEREAQEHAEARRLERNAKRRERYARQKQKME